MKFRCNDKRPGVRRLFIAGGVVAVIAIANFIAMFVLSSLFGGGPVGSEAEEGRYYLSPHGGALVEVSREMFLYSMWQWRVTIASMILAAALGLLYNIIARRNENGPSKA